MHIFIISYKVKVFFRAQEQDKKALLNYLYLKYKEQYNIFQKIIFDYSLYSVFFSDIQLYQLCIYADNKITARTLLEGKDDLFQLSKMIIAPNISNVVKNTQHYLNAIYDLLYQLTTSSHGILLSHYSATGFDIETEFLKMCGGPYNLTGEMILNAKNNKSLLDTVYALGWSDLLQRYANLQSDQSY